jgi:hypothetical protein
MNYKGKKYKKIDLYWKQHLNPIKEGDLIVLHCKPNNDYFKYNGIYVVEDHHSIHVKNYDGNGATLGIKLGYNVGYQYFSKLVEVKRKKSLPMPVKEGEY